MSGVALPSDFLGALLRRICTRRHGGAVVGQRADLQLAPADELVACRLLRLRLGERLEGSRALLDDRVTHREHVLDAPLRRCQRIQRLERVGS